MASAQSPDVQPRWGRPATPRSGACFYRNTNFRGNYFCVRPGETISYLSPGMESQVSSIRAFGNTEVTIFQDQEYRGRWSRLQGDVQDLRREGWSDRLSSIRVSSGYGTYHGRYGSQPNGYGLGTIESEPWQDDHVNHRATRYGRTDNADAVVRRVYQDVLVREPDPEGLALYRNHVINDRWSEQDVRNAVMASPEYRQRAALTPVQNAEQIVARSYRAVLGREPDPASRVYVDKVLRERWTEADVSRELRNSPEFRSKYPYGSATPSDREPSPRS